MNLYCFPYQQPTLRPLHLTIWFLVSFCLSRQHFSKGVLGMADWGPVIIAVVLFVLLTPGLLFQLPGRNRVVEFNNFQTSPASIAVHTVIFFGLITIFLIAIGVHIYTGWSFAGFNVRDWYGLRIWSVCVLFSCYRFSCLLLKCWLLWYCLLYLLGERLCTLLLAWFIIHASAMLCIR